MRLAPMLAALLLVACAPGQPSTAPEAALAKTIISDFRQQQGRSPVALDDRLQRLATEQAKAMARQDRLSHDVQGSLQARFQAARYEPGMAVENIAAGQEGVEQVLAAWRDSPGHRANLLKPGLRRMGLAMAPAPQSAFKRYWALIMSD